MQSSHTSLLIRDYCLILLCHIRRDNLTSLLGHDPGVYLCPGAEPEWFSHFNISPERVGHYRRFLALFACMGLGSIWLSSTEPTSQLTVTRSWVGPTVRHLGTWPFHGRLGAAAQLLRTCIWLLRNRRRYSYVLTHNISIKSTLPSLFAKLLLGKRFYIDYQDDYASRDNAAWYPIPMLTKLVTRLCDGAICINENMVAQFGGKDTRVVNGFADLSYMREMHEPVVKDNMTLLYSGSLDRIRGVDLIPELVAALNERISGFRVLITGTGPLSDEVRSWTLPEVSVILSFLGDCGYTCQES